MSSQYESQYEYSSLATPSTIRLIQVKKKKVNDVIDCAIRHVDYAEQPDFKYYALSYVWGDSSPTRKIYLGDPAGKKLTLPLHENLWRFLDWAWNRGLHDRWIWTDRICLNQQDKEEMAQQIPRMGKIFGNAAHVLAWLNMSKQEGLNLKACLEGTSNPTHRLVGPILKNQYWSRVWIVQEVLKAKDAVAVVGDVEVRLWDMKSRLQLLLEPRSGLIALLEMRNEGRLLGLMKAMQFSNFQCERAHDRVYGILGLLGTHQDGTSPADYIEVDYDKPLSHVIFDALLESPPDFAQFSEEQSLETVYRFWRDYAHRATRASTTIDDFMDYLDSEKTSERHKRLASHVILVCVGMAAIPPLRGSRTAALSEKEIISLVQGLHQKGLIWDHAFRSTLADSAVMIGILMTVFQFRFGTGLTDWGTDWQTYYKSFSSRDFSWTCATHKPSKSPKKRVRGESSLRFAYPDPGPCFIPCKQDLSGLSSCDGSEMTFVIPEVGFRLIWRQEKSRPTREYLRLYGRSTPPGTEMRMGEIHIQFLRPDPSAVQTTRGTGDSSKKPNIMQQISERIKSRFRTNRS